MYSAKRSVWVPCDAGLLLVSCRRLRLDEASFVAPALRAEVVTFSIDCDVEQVLDRWTAYEYDREELHNHLPNEVVEIAWPRNVSGLPIADILFSVPDQTTRLIYRYRRDGHLESVECLESSGALTSMIRIEYDEKVRQTRVIQVSGDYAVAEVRTCYADDGKRIETTTYLFGNAVSRSVCEVDDSGRTVLEEESSETARPHRVQYRYVENECGDWIQRFHYVDGSLSPSVRTERRITYR